MSTVFVRLRRSLDPEDYEIVKTAFAHLDPKRAKQGVEKEFHKFFVTDLHRYESDPFAKFAFLAALPGPVQVVGFSMGIHS